MFGKWFFNEIRFKLLQSPSPDVLFWLLCCMLCRDWKFDVYNLKYRRNEVLDSEYQKSLGKYSFIFSLLCLLNQRFDYKYAISLWFNVLISNPKMELNMTRFLALISREKKEFILTITCIKEKPKRRQSFVSNYGILKWMNQLHYDAKSKHKSFDKFCSFHSIVWNTTTWKKRRNKRNCYWYECNAHTWTMKYTRSRFICKAFPSTGEIEKLIAENTLAV